MRWGGVLKCVLCGEVYCEVGRCVEVCAVWGGVL